MEIKEQKQKINDARKILKIVGQYEILEEHISFGNYYNFSIKDTQLYSLVISELVKAGIVFYVTVEVLNEKNYLHICMRLF